jgi:hypothetical protein
MADVYKDFQREPSKSHQCMHESENDGTRCRAMAMQNNYMCYAHRTDDVPTVIENDMFLIDSLDTHEAIQKAFLATAARLACNHIDLKRAELLITLLRAASRNLRDAAAARRQALREAAAEAKAAAAAGAPGSTASSSTLGLNPADPLQNCHPERSSASAPNAVEGPAVASHTATAAVLTTLNAAAPRTANLTPAASGPPAAYAAGSAPPTSPARRFLPRSPMRAPRTE